MNSFTPWFIARLCQNFFLKIKKYFFTFIKISLHISVYSAHKVVVNEDYYYYIVRDITLNQFEIGAFGMIEPIHNIKPSHLLEKLDLLTESDFLRYIPNGSRFDQNEIFQGFFRLCNYSLDCYLFKKLTLICS